MNAAETIQAAIEKLEALKESATPGPFGFEDGWQPPQWKSIGHTYVRVVAGKPNHISGIRSMVLSTDGAMPGSEGKRRTLADAELIVTLHRTIDAQLTILREGLRAIESLDGLGIDTADIPWADVPELQLARSILGEDGQ
jgi:hypothetical protein